MALRSHTVLRWTDSWRPFCPGRAAALAVFACAVSLAATGSANARGPCWERVVSDWSADNRISGTYTAVCYREALAKLPEDLRTYSSAADDIRRGLQKQLARAPVAATVAANPADGGGDNRGLLVLGLVLAGVLAIAVVAIR
jgi:hypothetical protein